MPEMPTWKLRAPRLLTDAYVRVCKRRGTTASAELIQQMVKDVRRYGDAQDHADLKAALEEINRPRPGHTKR